LVSKKGEGSKGSIDVEAAPSWQKQEGDISGDEGTKIERTRKLREKTQIRFSPSNLRSAYLAC